MSELCRWLHEHLGELPLLRYPFDPNALPVTGVYFFYEDGEVWGHGGSSPRIVRTGTSRPGNFRIRIMEHFLSDERRVDFGGHDRKPSDRSIFRKNIGRALLHRDGDEYLRVWEIDFTPKANRDAHAHERDLDKERDLEARITEVLRSRFAFRYLMMHDEAEVLGRKKLEGRLIGTLGQCRLCGPSDGWLGQHSPKWKISTSGLWQEQHLTDEPINEIAQEALVDAISRTKGWIGR